MVAYIIVGFLLSVLLIWGGWSLFHFFSAVREEAQYEKDEYEYLNKHYPDCFPKEEQEKK